MGFDFVYGSGSDIAFANPRIVKKPKVLSSQYSRINISGWTRWSRRKAEYCRYDSFCPKSASADAIQVSDNVRLHSYKELDDMGSRIDELEQSINDLRAEMGVEGSPSPSAPQKDKEEPKSANDSA